MAIFLALFSSALWGSADFQGGRLAKRYNPLAVTGVSQAIGLTFGLFLVVVSGQWHAAAFGEHGYLIPGVLAGVAGYFGLNCLYAGLASGRMGVVSPISSLGALVPLTIALVGGETLNLTQRIGITLALVGAFCASGPEISQGLPLRSLLYAVGAACGFGAGLTLMARGSIGSALMTMVTMRASTLIFSVIYVARTRSMGGFAKKDFLGLAFMGLADFSANLLIGIASTHGLVSVVMVLGSLFPIATAVLAFEILHERLHFIQYIGVILAVGGVAVISAG